MTKSEQLLSALAEDYFFKELVLDDLYFTPEGSSKIELADLIINLGDIILAVQLKERSDAHQTNDPAAEYNWFQDRCKEAKKQVKQSIEHISSGTLPAFQNKRGQAVTLQSDAKIIPLVVFENNQIMEYPHVLRKHSASGMDINCMSFLDYCEMCRILVTPMEILEYLEYRKMIYVEHGDVDIMILNGPDNEIVLTQPQVKESLVHQFLAEKYGMKESQKHAMYIQYFRNFLRLLPERTVRSSDQAEAYYVLLFFAHMQRYEIAEFWDILENTKKEAKQGETGIRHSLRHDISEYVILFVANGLIEDLDQNSVLLFKERVNLRFPKKRYLEMDNTKFLVEIGACTQTHSTGELKIKRGALLFLGKVNSIKELFPHYHIDFFNHRGNNPRWSDRVSDDEPSDDEMNLFNFYRIVYEKMRLLLQEGFQLDGQQLRIPTSAFDETIRECLINCLAHADYILGYPSTKIDVYDGWFRFINPGKMLVSPQQFWAGGDSRPRNEVIMKLFRLLGMSERQGFGGPLIYKTAMQNDYRRPEITSDIEHTEIKVWNIDLADSYPNLTVDEKRILRFIAKGNSTPSIKNIKEALGITDYATRKAVQSLEESYLIRKIGSGPSTAYTLQVDSVEFLTKLQVVMEQLKKQMQ